MLTILFIILICIGLIISIIYMKKSTKEYCGGFSCINRNCFLGDNKAHIEYFKKMLDKELQRSNIKC